MYDHWKAPDWGGFIKFQIQKYVCKRDLCDTQQYNNENSLFCGESLPNW
jgi:hypothetical protein